MAVMPISGTSRLTTSLWSVKPTEHMAQRPAGYVQPSASYAGGIPSTFGMPTPQALPSFGGQVSNAPAGWLPAAGRISQAYGVTGNYAAGYHTGLDISAPVGMPVFSAGAGVVISAGWAGSYGYQVQVRHADGSVGLYAHLSRVNVRVGQQVGFGVNLGAVGSTGNSTGPHLHWEVRMPGNQYGQQYNPLNWLKSAGAAGGAANTFTGQTAPLNVGQLKGLAMQAGFTEGQASIMAAIAMKESAGRPTAYNGQTRTGDNSYGLWQINMIGAMGPARLRQFGITSNQQLFDPLTNARAAYAIFKQQGFNAWSVYKNGAYRQVLGAAQAATPQGVTSSGGYGTGGSGMDYLAGLASSATPEDLASGAGFSVAFFKSDPELWQLLQSALARGDDAANLKAAIQNSRWWKAHAEADRNFQYLLASDPATYWAEMEKRKEDVWAIAAQLGVTLTQADVDKVAKLALHGDWRESKIQAFLVDMSSVEKLLAAGEEMGGKAGELQDTLSKIAGDFGLEITDGTVASYAARILRGSGTVQDFLSFAQKQAKALYPHLSDDIDRGYSIADLANPYIQAASRLLEESPDAIQLNSDHIKWALSGNGEKMASLQEFNERIRRSNEWQTTDNARQSYDTFGREVLKNFGFAF